MLGCALSVLGFLFHIFNQQGVSSQQSRWPASFGIVEVWHIEQQQKCLDAAAAGSEVPASRASCGAFARSTESTAVPSPQAGVGTKLCSDMLPVWTFSSSSSSSYSYVWFLILLERCLSMDFSVLWYFSVLW